MKLEPAMMTTRLSANFRHGLATLLVGGVLLALVAGATAFFVAWGGILDWAASGQPATDSLVLGLLAAQRAFLLVAVALCALMSLALVLMIWDAVARAAGSRPETRTDLLAVEDMKSRFLEIVSHQLRTPLTAVRWNLESLLKGDFGALNQRQSDLINVTSKNYQDVLVMLADWIEALEAERGVVHLNLEPVDLTEIIDSMSHDFRGQAQLKRQKFAARLPRHLPFVQADRLKLRYVLSKLVNNAISYTGERGSVTVRATVNGQFVRVDVVDTGVGIPYEEQPSIFQKFFRASNASLMQPNASGVGLFVARTLVGAQGGQMGFTSEEGRGSDFWFTLPVLPKR